MASKSWSPSDGIAAVGGVQVTADTAVTVTAAAQTVAEPVVQGPGDTGTDAGAAIFTGAHRGTAAVLPLKQGERHRHRRGGRPGVLPVHVPGPGPAQIQADAFYLCAQGTGNSCLLTVVISVPVTAGRGGRVIAPLPSRRRQAEQPSHRLADARIPLIPGPAPLVLLQPCFSRVKGGHVLIFLTLM